MNEAIDFAKWMLNHSEEVLHTAGTNRRYKHTSLIDDWDYHNKVFTVPELYEIYLKFGK